MLFSENQLIADGAYLIQSYIARGGMAEVWRAERQSDGKICALKILTRRSLAAPQMVERFNLEYELLQKLHHPHIIAVHDFGWHPLKTSKLPWYTMDYYPQTFRQRLPQVSVGEGIRMLIPVLDALHSAHRKHICHRDLKPVNILVDDKGRAVLTDFGIAKEMDKDRNLTGKNIIGTATYISPEQCLGIPVVPASDLYSMGVILYQLCTGRYPFEDASEITIIQKHVKETPPDPQMLNPAISSRLNEIVMKCLAKRSEDRFQTALDLIRDLNQTQEMKDSAERILARDELLLGNRYRVLGLIEQGGFAEVYRVKDVKTGVVHALKVMLPALTYDEDSLRRFKREIQILKTLSHPHIIRVVADGMHEYKGLDLPFFIMPFFPGSLQGSMSEPIDQNKAMEIILDVLDALAYSHSAEHQIFHRDLKPSNILVSEEGRGHLTDFGIAKVSKALSTLMTKNATMTRAAIGTSAYNPPEQIRNDPVDGRADIYSMGVILYEIAAGRKPFDGKSADLTTAMHLYETPSPPSLFNPDVTSKLEEIILKCLEKPPEKRFKTVEELSKAIKGARYKGKWFGVGPVFQFNPRSFARSAIRSFRTSAPYMGMAAAFLTFVLGAVGAIGYRKLSIGLPPQGAQILSPAFYPLKTVRRIATRRESLAAALESALQRGGALALLPTNGQPPPEFLKAADDAGLFARYQALAAAREEAKKAADPALVTRLSWRINGLLERAPEPTIEFAQAMKSRKEIQTSRPAETVRIAIANTMDEAKVPFQYAYELFESGGSQPIKKGASESREFDLPELAVEKDYTLKVTASLMTQTPGAKYERPLDDFRFSVKRMEDKIAIERDGASWAAAAIKGELRDYRWILTSLSTGKEAPIGEGAKLDLKGDKLAAIPDGLYKLGCRATDAEGLAVGSRDQEITIDRTPPELVWSWEDGSPGQEILFKGESRAIHLAAKDDLPKGVEFYRDGQKIGGAEAALEAKDSIRWTEPGKGAAIMGVTVAYSARVPDALPAPLESPKAQAAFFAVSSGVIEKVDAWKAMERTIGDKPMYERTRRAAPLDGLAEILAVDESLPKLREAIRVRVASASGDPAAEVGKLFAEWDAAGKRRVDFRLMDEEFEDLRQAIWRIVDAPDADAAHKAKVKALLDGRAAAWAELPPDSGRTPKEILGEALARGALLPPVAPGNADAYVIARGDGDWKKGEVEILPTFAAKFGAKYRFRLDADDPGDDEPALLRRLEEKSKSEIADKRTFIASTASEAVEPRYLTIQLYLEQGPLGAPLESAPSKIVIEPLAKTDEAALAEIKSLEGAGTFAATQKGEAYARTRKWADAQGLPLAPGDQGRNGRIEWLLAASAKPSPPSALIEEFKLLRAGDEAFGEALKSLSDRTALWSSENQSALPAQLADRWIASQDAKADPAAFVEAAMAAYKKERAESLLKPPSATGLAEQVKPGAPIEVAAKKLAPADRLSELALAWTTDGKNYEPLGFASELERAGVIALDPPKGEPKKFRLAMRFEKKDDDGTLLASKWAPAIDFSPEPPTPSPKPTKPPTPEPTISMKPTTAPPMTPAPTKPMTPMPSPSPMKTAAMTSAMTPEPTTPPPAAGEITIGEAQKFADEILAEIGKGKFDDYAKRFVDPSKPKSGILKNFNRGTIPGDLSSGRFKMTALKVAKKADGRNRFDMILTTMGNRQSNYVFELERSGGRLAIVSDEFKK